MRVARIGGAAAVLVVSLAGSGCADRAGAAIPAATPAVDQAAVEDVEAALADAETVVASIEAELAEDDR